MTEAQTTKTTAGGAPRAASTADQRAAMLMHHIAKVRPLQAIHEEKKAAATAAATNVTSSLDVAVADLNGFAGPKVDRDWLKRRITMASRDQRDLLEELVLDRWANGVQGVVDQIDAFGTEATPQAAKDGLYFNAQGYQHGVNGLAFAPPEGMHSMFHNDYATGHANGQTALSAYLEHGKALKAAQSTPSTAAPVNLSGDAEDEDGDEDGDIDDAARALKAGGFMETGSGEPDEAETLADKLRETGFAPEAPKRRRAPKGVH